VFRDITDPYICVSDNFHSVSVGMIYHCFNSTCWGTLKRKDGRYVPRLWQTSKFPPKIDRMRGNGFKLKEGRFRLAVRKTFFRMKVVKPWNMLPREVVDTPSLEMLKARLNGVLSNVVWLKISLLTAGALG